MERTESIREFMKRSVLEGNPEVTCARPILSVEEMEVRTDSNGNATVRGDVACQNCNMGYQILPTEIEFTLSLLSENAQPFAPHPPKEENYDRVI